MEALQRVDNVLAERLLMIKRRSQQTGEKPNLTSVAEMAGINRATISQIANGQRIATPEQAEAIWAAVDKLEGGDAADNAIDNAVEDAIETDNTKPESQNVTYKRGVEIYETAQYQEAMGWCGYIREHRKMGVMIGHPGSGKTTALKAFCAKTGARYIECWPMMHTGDLLYEIAAAIGVDLSAQTTIYRRIKQLTAELSKRDDVTLVFDEAEQMREEKNSVKKFEILRKIWDNTATPIILADTLKLRDLLTRGGGHDNLSQLYRRKYEFEFTGITPKEARAILREYNLTADAAAELCRIATDIRHGGMGTFVEVLSLCLDAAQGSRIDAGILAGAKRYKLTY